MIPITSEQDKAQLKKHALELLEEDDYEGLVILVEVLKETDFEIKDKNEALFWFSRRGNLEVLKYLVENGADIHAAKDSALSSAAFNGHLEIVKYLVEHGADIHSEHNRALRWAAERGYLEIVNYLVEHGANIHAKNDYALRKAEKYGHTEVVEYLKEVIKNDNTHQ